MDTDLISGMISNNVIGDRSIISFYIAENSAAFIPFYFNSCIKKAVT